MGLSKDDAQVLFGPYGKKLWKAVVELGFERYKKTQFRSAHRSSTAASIIHDLIVAGAREVFEGDSRIRFIEVRGTDITLMEIEERVLVWFKKLGPDHMANGNDTERSRDLMRGICDDLPGVAVASAVVIVGYITNIAQTRVATVSVVRPSGGKRPAWFFDFAQPKEDTARVIKGGTETSRRRSTIRIIGGAEQAKLS